jgi:hypothetical protein
VLVLLLQGIYHCSGAFSFSVILLFFLAVCIRIATRALRCCRGWMYLVSVDINIYSLSKKKGKAGKQDSHHTAEPELFIVLCMW